MDFKEMPNFFFNDTATTEIYTLSLHDALPISVEGALPGELSEYAGAGGGADRVEVTLVESRDRLRHAGGRVGRGERSEEHTSELQSQSNLVCRLLLEKKKPYKPHYVR